MMICLSFFNIHIFFCLNLFVCYICHLITICIYWTLARFSFNNNIRKQNIIRRNYPEYYDYIFGRSTRGIMEYRVIHNTSDRVKFAVTRYDRRSLN